MKKYFVVTLLFFSFLSIARSGNYTRIFDDSVKVIVGKSPVAIFEHNGHFGDCYILCSGYDKNFNAKLDSADGDEPPSLWRFGLPFVLTSIKTEYAEKIADFSFDALSFPERFAVKPFQSLLYFSQNNKIKCYNYEERKDVKNGLTDIDGFSVFINDKYLFASVRVDTNADWVPDNNYVVRYELQSETPIDTIHAGSFVQQCLVNESGELEILCEGAYGQNEAKLMFVDISGFKSKVLATIDVGNGGNHISSSEGKTVVVLNGSHEIKVIDEVKRQIITTIKTPTTGWNGPRETVIHGDLIYASAYNGFVYVYSLTTGAALDTLPTYGKAEGIFYSKYYPILGIANIQQTGTLNPDSTAVFYFVKPTSVDDISNKASIQIYPNPATDYIVLSMENTASTVNFEIIDNQSKVIKTDIAVSVKDLRIDLANFNLTLGTYYIKIKSDNIRTILPFTVLK